ncbi:MAG: AAA family ATPase [Halobacteriota archaeon]|nr:AAA family ATPase [Halobacteriota archaeon]
MSVSPKSLAIILAKTIGSGLPVLIKGQPGVGKSDIVAQACEAAGSDLLIYHPVVDDPTDYKGMPFIVNGKAVFLPFNNLEKLITADKKTVCFFDDLGQAPPVVQAAVMQLLLARRINDKKVSDHVTFIAATNRKSDRAGVSGILEPVKSRFATILHLEPSLEDWVEWAGNNDMPPELVSFIRFKPQYLNAFEATSDIVNTPCPRTVANVGSLMKIGLPKNEELKVFAGAAGDAFAIELSAFLKLARTIPDIDYVYSNPDTVAIPTDPAVLYAFCGAIAHHANKKNADVFFKLAYRLPQEFSVFCVNDAINRDEAIAQTGDYGQWVARNSPAMTR